MTGRTRRHAKVSWAGTRSAPPGEFAPHERRNTTKSQTGSVQCHSDGVRATVVEQSPARHYKSHRGIR
eukprot:2398720-Prymnesium_polylepis.1